MRVDFCVNLNITLMGLILDDSNGLFDEPRNVLDKTILGFFVKFLNKSKNILNNLKDETERMRLSVDKF